MAKKPGKGDKTKAAIKAIRQIAKDSKIPVGEVKHKQCNNVLRHQHGFTISDPLFYQCRNSVEDEKGKKKLKCKVCGKTFKENWELATHSRLQHAKPAVAPAPAPVASDPPQRKKRRKYRRRQPAAVNGTGGVVHMDELPKLVVQARTLVASLGGKDFAKKFIDVV